MLQSEMLYRLQGSRRIGGMTPVTYANCLTRLSPSKAYVTSHTGSPFY
jgi:hypothetical protein